MFRQTGGVKIGRDFRRCWNIGWPFARLLVGADVIEIRVFLFGITKKYRFARAEIVALRVYRTRFSCGVSIEHRNEKFPQLLAFEAFPPRRLDAILQALRAADFDIEEVAPQPVNSPRV